MWRQFYNMVRVGAQGIALRAGSNNQYVCAKNAGAQPLIANRTAIGTWEQFDLNG